MMADRRPHEFKYPTVLTDGELAAEVERLRAVLTDIVGWCKVYPAPVILDADWVKARALLASGGISIGAITTAAARLALTEMGAIAQRGLTGDPPPAATH